MSQAVPGISIVFGHKIINQWNSFIPVDYDHYKYININTMHLIDLQMYTEHWDQELIIGSIIV